MAYKIRPGVSKIQVCGQNLLVASRSVWEDLPRVRPIPKTWGVCWALLLPDRTDEEAIRTFSKIFHKPEEEVKARFGKVFREMAEEGYLVEASAEEAAENSSEPYIIQVPEDLA